MPKMKIRKMSHGAALVEYVILIGLISIVSIGSVVGLGNSVDGMFETATAVLGDPEVDHDSTVDHEDEGGEFIDPGGDFDGFPDFPDLGGPADDHDPIGPFEIGPGECLVDSTGYTVYCGEPQLLEIPDEVTFQRTPADVPYYFGLMCAYDVQNGEFYTKFDMGMTIYSCMYIERNCIIRTVDGTRYDKAWGGATEAQVIANNDLYCEPDPSNPGGVRPKDGAWRIDVSE